MSAAIFYKADRLGSRGCNLIMGDTPSCHIGLTKPQTTHLFLRIIYSHSHVGDDNYMRYSG